MDVPCRPFYPGPEHWLRVFPAGDRPGQGSSLRRSFDYHSLPWRVHDHLQSDRFPDYSGDFDCRGSHRGETHAPDHPWWVLRRVSHCLDWDLAVHYLCPADLESRRPGSQHAHPADHFLHRSCAFHSGGPLLRDAFPETVSASESIGDESLHVLGTCHQQGEKIAYRKRLLREKWITGRLMS